MMKTKPLETWDKLQDLKQNAYKALEKIETFTWSQEYEEMCKALKGNEEFNYHETFQEFLDDLPEAMGY